MIKIKKYIIALIVLFNIGVSNNVYANKFEETNDIPYGFENISFSKQLAYVEIFIGENFIGVFKIIYDDKYIKIDDYEKIYKKISSIYKIKDEYKENLFIELSKNKEIKFNKDNLINYKINFERFDINLILNEKIFDSDLSRKNSILEKSTSKNFSSINKFITNYSYNEDNDFVYNFNYYGRNSIKNNRFNYDLNYYDNHFEINSLNYENEKNGKYLKTGYIEVTGNNIIDNKEIFGASFGTSYDTRLDLKNNYNQPITIALSEDSLVSIYKGKKLLYTQNLNVGVNNIYPKNMPNGGYIITIVKTDKSGNVSSYEEFYSKTNFLPPKDEFLWNFDIGLNTEELEQNSTFPKIENSPFARFSIFNRLGDKSSLKTEFQLYNDKLYYVPTFYFYNENFNISTSFGINEDKDYKIYSIFNYNLNNNGNIYLTHEQNEINNILKNKINFSYNYNFGNLGIITFNSTYIDHEKSKVDYYIDYNKSFNLKNKGNLSISTSFGEVDNEYKILIGLKYNISVGKQNFSYKFEENRKLNPNQMLGYQIQHDNSSTSLQLENNNNKNNVNFYNALNYQDLISSDFYYMNSDGDNNIYGNLKTSIIYNEESTLISNKNEYNNGIIVEVDNKENYNDENMKFDVFIDSKYNSTINLNEKKYIPLNSYNNYIVEVYPNKNNLFTKVENKSEIIVTYPNNVQTIGWKAYKYKILFTRIFDKNKNPIRNKEIITDIGSYYTDGDGFVQLEISDDLSIKNYKCTYSDLKEKKNIIYLDNMLCNSIS